MTDHLSAASALEGTATIPAPGEVHVWYVALADLPSDAAALATILTEAERARAARFAFPHLSLRWLRSRFALRRILAGYDGRPASTLAFGAGERGKPFLLDASGGAASLDFNMSDSGEHVLIAAASRQAVGIDIEAVRPMADVDQIVARNFSVLERAAYGCLAPERRALGFFTGWTRKEAFVKAVGLGLYLPLDSFSVTLDPDASARLIEIDGDPAKAAAWSLLPVEAPAGHVAALAVQGAVKNLAIRRWRHVG